MMKVDIDRFGLKSVEIDPNSVFVFPKGILGYEDCQQFKVFHEVDKSAVFFLQALNNSEATFPIVSPEVAGLEYQFELSDEECALLDVQSQREITVAVIVYRDAADNGKISANSRSPIVLNTRTLRGMQKVLSAAHPTLLYRE